MKIKAVLLCFVISLFWMNNSICQDASFTNFTQSLTYSNPAFTGSAETARVASSYHYRTVSPSFDLVSVHVAADAQVFKKHSVGINYLFDSAPRGFFTEQLVNLSYAYFQPLTDSLTVRLGASLGVVNKNLDLSQFTFSTIVDPRLGFVYSEDNTFTQGSVTALDASLGLVLQHKRFYLGYSLNHLNKPNVSLLGGNSPLPPRHDFQAGINFPFENGMVTFSGNKVAQGITARTRLRSQVIFHHILLGTGTAVNDWSVIPLFLGVDFEHFRFVYNYQERFRPSDQLLGIKMHEVNLNIFLNRKKENSSPIVY